VSTSWPGAGTAITTHLAQAADRPPRITVTDVDPGRLDHVRTVHERAGVPVEADGGFSVPAVSLHNAADHLCRLRAVPAGETPADPSPFAGPVLATSEDFRTSIGSGPNVGTLSDYYFFAQQVPAAFDYYSTGSCGLGDGYLFANALTDAQIADLAAWYAAIEVTATVPGR
jgi:hypothetical protein